VPRAHGYFRGQPWSARHPFGVPPPRVAGLCDLRKQIALRNNQLALSAWNTSGPPSYHALRGRNAKPHSTQTR